MRITEQDRYLLQLSKAQAIGLKEEAAELFSMYLHTSKPVYRDMVEEDVAEVFHRSGGKFSSIALHESLSDIDAALRDVQIKGLDI